MFESNYKTAIVRRGVSAPVKKLIRSGAIRQGGRGGRILDYGCGKGMDADRLQCDRFDPYYFPSLHLDPVYDQILCTYVLNVVSEEEQAKIISNMVKLLNIDNPHSIIFASVRRDIPREGTATQRWVELNSPFVRYTSMSAFQIYYARRCDFVESKPNT